MLSTKNKGNQENLSKKKAFEILRNKLKSLVFLLPSNTTFLKEAEEAAAIRAAKVEAKIAAHEASLHPVAKSPSDFSCHSYELFVGQEKGNDDNNKEKMSIKSDGLDSANDIARTIPQGSVGVLANKVRKVSVVSNLNKIIKRP